MTFAATSASKAVSSNGQLTITIEQLSYNQGANTSQVLVKGTIKNTGSTESYDRDTDVTCSISGDQSYTGPDFSFDLGPGDSTDFISHTFTVHHSDSDLSASVDFTVHYGDNGTSTFPADSKEATLTLWSPPDPPHGLTFSNELPTSLTIDWSSPPHNNGSDIINYFLRRYTGGSPSGSYNSDSGNSLERNQTGLTPAQEYTYTVVAVNGVGTSLESDPATVTMIAGAHVRVGGVWKVAVPYVRTGGVWKQAVPYVRSGGTWKLTS
jgi:Fibronectin type III domain